MNKVLHATYHDGNLILDEKLDAALEGQKLTLILVEEPVASTSTGANLYEAYIDSILIQSAVERQLEILGEAARRLSDEFRQAHPEIDWC